MERTTIKQLMHAVSRLNAVTLEVHKMDTTNKRTVYALQCPDGRDWLTLDVYNSAGGTSGSVAITADNREMAGRIENFKQFELGRLNKLREAQTVAD